MMSRTLWIPPGHSLVLDTWLDSPVAYSASIYYSTCLHNIYTTLKRPNKRQISAQDSPEQFCHLVKQKSQIFHQLSLQNNIDKAKVIEAFGTEENNHLHCSNQSTMLANAKKSNLECRQTAKQEKRQTKKDQKAQQADTGAPPSPPEA